MDDYDLIETYNYNQNVNFEFINKKTKKIFIQSFQ